MSTYNMFLWNQCASNEYPQRFHGNIRKIPTFRFKQAPYLQPNFHMKWPASSSIPASQNISFFKQKRKQKQRILIWITCCIGL